MSESFPVQTTPDEVIEQIRAAMYGSLGWAEPTLYKQRKQIREFIGAVYSAGYQILSVRGCAGMTDQPNPTIEEIIERTSSPLFHATKSLEQRIKDLEIDVNILARIMLRRLVPPQGYRVTTEKIEDV